MKIDQLSDIVIPMFFRKTLHNLRGRFELDQPYKQTESKMQGTVKIWSNK